MLAAGLPDMIMTDDNNNVTRRKLLGSMAIVGAASAGAGAGTYAYITDNEDASFSFQSGSIILKISPEIIDFTEEKLDEENSEDNKQDDGSEMRTTITVTNAGTLPVGRLLLDGMSLVTEQSGADDLKKGAEVTTLDVVYPNGDAESILSSIDDATPDANGNNIFDLADLEDKANANTKLEMLRSGDTLKPLNANSFELTIGVTYDYSQVTTNGGSLTASLEFSAIQQS